jgi:hypothetical protein
LAFSNVRFYLFAKAGFTKGCAEKAGKLGNVALITFKDMVSLDV